MPTELDTTDTAVADVHNAPPAPNPAPRTNGLTEEQIQNLFAHLEKRKNDPRTPGYLERGAAGIAEYRRLIQE